MYAVLTVVSLVVAVSAEAPYHLPRPAGHAPAFHLPAPQARPLPQFAPQPQQGPGFQYQQPNFAPTFVQHAPQHVHHHHQPAPAPQQFFPQPQPAPFLQPQPQPAPFLQPQPQPAPFLQPQPAPLPQPSPSYDLPQVPQLSAPIQHHPTFVAPQPAPQVHFHQPQQQLLQPQPQFSQSQFSQPQLSQPQYSLEGYNYQQPQPLFSQQIPLQAQPLNSHVPSSLSSYQADSTQYSGVQDQIHRDALDSVVIGRLQNIIKDDEHNSARNAGFLSLVSGVSLENAKPSVELSSFVQTSPLVSSGISHGSSASISAPSQDYGVPSVGSASHSSGTGSFNSGSYNFLPQTKPALSYGPPR